MQFLMLFIICGVSYSKPSREEQFNKKILDVIPEDPIRGNIDSVIHKYEEVLDDEELEDSALHEMTVDDYRHHLVSEMSSFMRSANELPLEDSLAKLVCTSCFKRYDVCKDICSDFGKKRKYLDKIACLSTCFNDWITCCITHSQQKKASVKEEKEKGVKDPKPFQKGGDKLGLKGGGKYKNGKDGEKDNQSSKGNIKLELDKHEKDHKNEPKDEKDHGKDGKLKLDKDGEKDAKIHKDKGKYKQGIKLVEKDKDLKAGGSDKIGHEKGEKDHPKKGFKVGVKDHLNRKEEKENKEGERDVKGKESSKDGKDELYFKHENKPAIYLI